MSVPLKINKENRSKVLVTGVAGFIGRHVAESCLRLGMDVTGIDDLSGGFIDNVPQGLKFIQGDITDDSLIRSITEEGRFDYFYHLAAYAAEGLSHFIRRFNYNNNLIGSATLLNAAIRTKVKCFVFTSSIAVYGKNQLPMTEYMVPQPEDPYGIAKYAIELDLKSAHEMFGLNYIIFRPHNVYGEHQNIADMYRNVVGIFMNQILEKKPLSIFGDGLQTRGFSYIADVAPVIAQSPLLPSVYNEVFNIGADTPCTVLELAREVARAFNVDPNLVFLEARKEVVHAYADHEKLRKRFPSLPLPTDLRTGIERMAEWVKKLGARQRIGFRNIEIFEKIPPVWLERDA
jgi:UDP-glucose 4-epimerase